MQIGQFVEKVEGEPKLKESYKRFITWAGNEETRGRTILMAETLEKVFKLEVNVPYEPWYGRIPSHFTKENLSLLNEETRALVSEGLLKADEVEAYLKKLEPLRV